MAEDAPNPVPSNEVYDLKRTPFKVVEGGEGLRPAAFSVWELRGLNIWNQVLGEQTTY